MNLRPFVRENGVEPSERTCNNSAPWAEMTSAQWQRPNQNVLPASDPHIDHRETIQTVVSEPDPVFRIMSLTPLAPNRKQPWTHVDMQIACHADPSCSHGAVEARSAEVLYNPVSWALEPAAYKRSG